MDHGDDDIHLGNYRTSKEQRRRFTKKPRLRLELFKSSSRRERNSPESEDDILTVLDLTPDIRDGVSKFGQRSINYSRVYVLQKFSEIMPHVFIRDQQLTLSVIKVEHLSGTISFLNQYVLTILLQHGDCQWIIKRKAKQISSLHSQLRYFKALLRVPAATSQGRERRQSMRDQIKNDDELQRRNSSARRIVKFPRRELQRLDSTSKQAIETYMRNLLHHSLLRSHHAVLEFFEISPLSFVLSLGTKLREGYVKKKSHTSDTFMCGGQCPSRFKTMWMILKESYLFLVWPSNGQIHTVMLMDEAFQVSHGFRHTGVPRGLRVTNLSRSLVLLCDGEETEKEWASSIENVKNTHGDDFIKENRFSSFTPVRKISKARWYVDGSTYMHDVADLLELAEEEIFITDWWLSPDIYLKRPDQTGKYWMLSEVLKRQADRGIKIFILLYKEVEIALGINSLYSKHSLSKLSPNIKVLRHPDHLKSGTLYWAHHEKMVVIDQMYAFVGGIDMCYGRWDNHQHKLVDIGHGGRKFKRPSSSSLGLGQLIQGSHNMFTAGLLRQLPISAPAACDVTGSNYGLDSNWNAESKSNESFNTGSDVRSSDSEDKCVRKTPILPNSTYIPDNWELKDNPPLDKDSRSNHTSHTENHIIAVDSQLSDDSDSNQEARNELDSKSNWNLKSMKAIGMEIVEEVRRKRGKSVASRAKERIYRSTSADSEFFLQSDSDNEQLERGNRKKRLQLRWKKGLRRNRRRVGSVPWKATSLADLHKEMCYEEGGSVHLWVGKDYVNWITKDLEDPDSPFKDTVNRLKTPRMPWHDIALYTEGEAARDAARHFIQRWNSVKYNKVKKKDHYPFLIPKTYNPTTFRNSPLKPKHPVKCQVLRSVGPWSAGLVEEEHSIYNAYLYTIKKAKHYIYIENQFFITSCSGDRNGVLNTIGLQLFERILQAHRNKETFRVYIVVPLLPAFAGLVGTPSGTTMQYIIYYIYSSIIRGQNSLIERLIEENVCYQNYLTFCSVRTHELLDDELVSELIYIHSKLLIVDDRIVIAGSANINDRSMLGGRDSELALMIEDTEFTAGKMNNEPYDRGDFAGSLRMYLFNEHLGILGSQTNIDITDPVCDRFFKNWQGIASRNTKIYEEVFNCTPCDAAVTFNELRKIRSQTLLARKSPEIAKERLEKIQGHLVLYPLKFLEKELLKPRLGNKEFLLPFEMWT